MDIEKTMQFIVDTQASTSAMLKELAERQNRADARADRAEARMDKADARADRAEIRMNRADARMDRADARMDRAEARADRFDKSLEGIRKLIQAGMKMMAQNQQAIKELTAAQKQTERRLTAFLASMEKGRNGRGHT